MKRSDPGRVRQHDSTQSVTPRNWYTFDSGTMVNPKGWAALHVVIQRLLSTQDEDEKLIDLYDQLVLVENPGAIVVCCLNSRVALVQNFRFTAERLIDQPDYVRRLAGENRWNDLLSSLGRWRWELPRGIAPPCEDEDIERCVTRCAQLESLEECGFEIENARICGRINPNSSFFVHSQYVVSCDVKRRTESSPELFEMIGSTQFFDRGGIRELIARGEFEDGLSLAALSVSGFWDLT